MQITLIDGESPGHDVVTIDIEAPDVTMLGWERKPQGLCRGDVCVPVPDGVLSLNQVAQALRRPLVIDESAGVGALGASWLDRSASLASGVAPDFTLPDLAGDSWTLSQFRGRKVVVYAYASW
jgi:AhpC/TSA family